jgi:hypothetical protein
MAGNILYDYHVRQDVELALASLERARLQTDIEFTYTFANFFHPFVGELIEKLNQESLSGLLDADFHKSLETSFFDEFYEALNTRLVKVKHSPKAIDVAGGPYANYNWELLFHIPLTIAVHLSKNQRFAEAQRWFHYIFDPTCNDTTQPVPERFWKFLAFRDVGDVTRIDEPNEWYAFVTGGEDFATQVKRDHFPYFTHGRSITINSLRLYAIKDETLESATPPQLVTPVLDNATTAFDLSLAPDAVLVREEQAEVFVLIKYAVES